jgi:hypothetical protein
MKTNNMQQLLFDTQVAKRLSKGLLRSNLNLCQTAKAVADTELLFELKKDSYIKGFLYKKGVRLKLLPQEAKSFIANGVLVEVEGVMEGFSNQQNIKQKRTRKCGSVCKKDNKLYINNNEVNNGRTR